MIQKIKYHPLNFFLMSFFITATFWLFGAYLSWSGSMQFLIFPLVFLGMSGPTLAMIAMLLKSKNMFLRIDFFQRLSLKK